ARLGQGRADRLNVRVNHNLGFDPDPQEPIVCVFSDRCGTPDSIKFDAIGSCDRIRGALHCAWIQRRHRVLKGLDVASEDLFDDLWRVVGPAQILMDELDRLNKVSRQRDLELLESLCSYALAEADDAAFARARCFRDLGDGHMYDV